MSNGVVNKLQTTKTALFFYIRNILYNKLKASIWKVSNSNSTHMPCLFSLHVLTKYQRNVLLKHRTKQNKTKHLPWNPLKWLGANYVRVLFNGWNENLFDKSAFSHSSTLRLSHELEHIIYTYYIPIPFHSGKYAKKFYSTLISRSIFGLSSNVQILCV